MKAFKLIAKIWLSLVSLAFIGGIIYLCLTSWECLAIFSAFVVAVFTSICINVLIEDG